MTIERNFAHELPVPVEWRPIIAEIVDQVRCDKYNFSSLNNVSFDEGATAKYIRNHVAEYGDEIAPLPEAAWDTSIYLAVHDWWDVLVDLYTIDDGLSDLVLFLRVLEVDNQYHFYVRSVHVP